MDLRELQITRETQGLSDSATAYKDNFLNMSLSNTGIGSFIIGKAMKSMEQSIKDYQEGVQRWNCDTLWVVHKTLPVLELATVTLKFMLDKVFSGHGGFRKSSSTSNCVSSLSIQLGSTILSHFNWYVFRSKNLRMVKHMEAFLKGKSFLYRSRTIKWYKRLLNHQELKIPTRDKAALGYPLLKAAIETTGMFEVVERSLGTRRASIVVPSADVVNNIMNSLDRLSMMHPVFQPMIVPPEPWTSYNNGGYITLDAAIVTHQRDTAVQLENEGCLSSRCGVLNRIQSVPWEVNKKVLEVATWAYYHNHKITPVCDMGVAIPPRPWTSNTDYLWLKENKPQVVAEWKQQAAVVMNKFYGNRTIGQRLSFLRCLSLAKDYSQFEAIWFPWRMDYRGRFYPMPHTLSPQGDDLSRSLLMFHDRTPLTPANPDGWRWFLIQGANLIGNDKVTFDERVSYIRKYHHEICASAKDPRNNEWWTEADKPWCMLAWCFEYEAIVSGRQDYTQLPVNMDGRCNGLQHLSAAIRDETTGALVGLVPADKPSDIYTYVLNNVIKEIPEDSCWYGKVDRALVKRNVMTTPYNVTRDGMRSQLEAELLSRSANNTLSTEDKYHIHELRDYNYKTITSCLGKTMELMQWYNVVAGLYMKRGLRITWLLPDNFKVIQDLPQTKTKQVALEFRSVFINYREKTDRQEITRNKSAFSPNLTHSMDATHMAMWVRQLPDAVPFTVIHDSYGVPSPYVSSIRRTITQTFVELYESFDIIEAIQQDYLRLTGEELPPPPTRGSLDLKATLNSDYAFA